MKAILAIFMLTLVGFQSADASRVKQRWDPKVVARNAVPLGCWDDSRSDRAMPIYVRNMRNDIDWKNVHLIVEQCMAEAVAKGYQCIGVQFFGECWSGPNACETYKKYGESKRCWNGVGQSLTNYVYKVKSTGPMTLPSEMPTAGPTEMPTTIPTTQLPTTMHHGTKPRWEPKVVADNTTPLGCWAESRRHRAMPIIIGDFRRNIDYKNMHLLVAQCMEKAIASGYKCIGIQYFGECWSGPNACETYKKYGRSRNCWNGVGKEMTSYVYALKE